ALRGRGAAARHRRRHHPAVKTGPVQAGPLELARASYDAWQWTRAYDGFAAAELTGRLEAPDYDRFAVASMMLGRVEDYFAIRDRCYRQQEADGDVLGCAATALWIGMQRM